MTEDVVGMLRSYWEDPGKAGILADALDEWQYGLGKLIRLPLEGSIDRRKRMEYNAAFREFWPAIREAAPVNEVFVHGLSSVLEPFVALRWCDSGVVQKWNESRPSRTSSQASLTLGSQP